MIRFALLFSAALVVATMPASARSKRTPDADDTETTSPAKTGKKGAKAEPGATDEGTKSSTGRNARGKGGKPASDGKAAKDSKDAKNKPVQVGTFGDWGAFTAQGKGKTCYALAQPRDRAPANIKRDAAYVFISNRPGENVRNEVSIIMGFPMKDNSDAKAEIGTTTFDLICKGTNAWVKNAAKEGEFIDALRRGSKLVIKASSLKGNLNTDSYSLGGLSEALARVQKDCP